MEKNNRDKLFRMAVTQEELLRCAELFEAVGYDAYDARASLCEVDTPHTPHKSIFAYLSGAVKKLIIVGGLAALLSSCTAKWGNVQPAYNIKQQHATVRVEGGGKIGKNADWYAFTDIDGTRKDNFDLDSAYVEARANYHIAEGKAGTLAAAAEVNDGTGMEGLLRLGLTYRTEPWSGGFVQVKVFPTAVGNQNAQQISLFVSQDLGDKLTAMITTDYSLNEWKPTLLYIEPEVDIKFNQNGALFIQGRGILVPGESMSINPIVGVKYGF